MKNGQNIILYYTRTIQTDSLMVNPRGHGHNHTNAVPLIVTGKLCQVKPEKMSEI